MTAIRDLNGNFKEKAQELAAWSKDDSLLQAKAQDLVRRFGEEYSDPKELLQLLHETQRTSLIFAAGAQNDAALLESLAQTSSPEWQTLPDLPVEDALQKSVAEQLLATPMTKKDPNIRVTLSAYAPKVGEHIADQLVERGHNFDVSIGNGDWHKRFLDGLDEAAVKRAGEYAGERALRVEKSISVGAQTEDSRVEPNEAKREIYNGTWEKEAHRVRMSTDLFYTLTRIPTPADAKLDGMEYDAYLKLFFELCDQPWEQISKAQEKLIEKFDKANEIHITSDDGTDITLDISGQTFANSVVKKNVPGSEIFSSPHRNGVNGTLVCKGKFLPKNQGEIIENMVLKFVNGEVVEATAEKGEVALKKTLATDEGARFPGEIGIGTNPWLKQHVMNGLLVEKISGSFHIALGSCYDYTEYDGKPVNLKNGNSSKIHWDVTTMLLGRGGKMYLDGELIQENGKYLAPEFDVFNRGWESVPPKERPDYWKNLLNDRDKRKTAQETRGR